MLTLGSLATLVLPSVGVGRALSGSEWWTLVRVAEVLLEGAAIDLRAEQAADNVEAFLVAGRSRRAWRVRLLLRTIELSSLATHGKRFSRMSIERRRALVREHWTSGRHIWRLSAKVRNLVILGAYGDRHAGASTGYVPVPLRPRFRNTNAITTGRVA